MMKNKFTPKTFLNQQIQLAGPDGQLIDIPPGGAIGLLALGDLGIIAWRQKRLQLKTELGRRTQENLATDQDADSTTSKSNENGNH